MATTRRKSRPRRRKATPRPEVSFRDLLESAVTAPGKIHEAFTAFHNYSFGNQILAMTQCLEREIPIGPIASFMGWKEKGRHVRKGQKALVLCMPVTRKRTETDDDGNETEVRFTRFIYRPNWFVLAQTEGQALAETAPAIEWDRARALAALDITEVPFDLTNGNIGGYAKGRSIAVNPVAPMPHRTRFHEMAHVLLGHTTGDATLTDGQVLNRHERELEAECVALCVGAALGLTDGIEYSRGYIQNWWGEGNPVPEKNAQRILKVVDQILKSGRVTADDGAAA